ncbi:hypothetical protein [Streptacidiphilus cavernicola]|uniref:Uncharacterized protein n=1 Tax=Streptacidiphilus cavernicola TaxID=3342716 RepID=A0ABV6VSU0_9ACTN
MGGIGHAVLYVAFAAVALWLLGELLLQHRAEPHWRGLALLGFLGLVAGVARGSLPLIAVGVVGFGVGQYLVSRSVRTGGRTHWSLRAADGSLPGPLAGLPLLGSVFPTTTAETPPEPAAPQQPEPPEPEPEQLPEPAPEYTYTTYDYSGYDQQQQYQPYEQQPQYDYSGYDQQQQYPQQQQDQYQYQQQGYYYEQQPYPYYPYQPEPVAAPGEPEPEPGGWPPQYG